VLERENMADMSDLQFYYGLRDYLNLKGEYTQPNFKYGDSNNSDTGDAGFAENGMLFIIERE